MMLPTHPLFDILPENLLKKYLLGFVATIGPTGVTILAITIAASIINNNGVKIHVPDYLQIYKLV